MGSVIGEEKHLVIGATSLLTPPPKYKRRKVSAVRKFPPGCGPNALLVFKETEAKGVQGDDELNFDDVVKNVLKDIEYGGEKDGEHEELKNLSAENNNASKEIQYFKENSILRDEKHEISNELMLEIPTELKDSDIIDDPKELADACNNKIGEETSAEQHLLPHHPVPPNLVWKEPKYPPPRKVSAIRKFPTGCGHNMSSIKIKDTQEKRTESDEGVPQKMIIQAPVLGQSSEIEGGEKNLEDNHDEQHMEKSGYDRKDELDNVKDEDERKKSVGVSISNTELQEESVPDTEIEKGIIVQGIMCEASSPWRQVKGGAKSSLLKVGAKESKGKKRGSDAHNKQKRVITKGKDFSDKAAEKSMMIVPYHEIEMDEVFRPLALTNDEYDSENEEHNDFQLVSRPRNSDATVPPFIVGSTSETGSRKKVRETLRLFQVLVRRILQGEETKTKEKGKAGKRVDICASNMLKEKGKYINTEKVIGAIPGVEIGDIFSYRLELAVIGLHSPLQGGIDTIKLGKRSLAISVVASGGYDNDVNSSDVLVYTGQGGNPTGPDKQPEDQKLERANLALKNSFDDRIPVRVIRGSKESKSAERNGHGRSKMVATYTYDGLYTVERYWSEIGSHGKLVYKFELRRIPGQQQLAWKEVKQSKKCKIREGCCVDDISNGKEKPPICAINTIDDEKPPQFTYITSTMYPDWCRPIPPEGCSCENGCSDSDRCACTIRNGGEIPYNLSGAIVEVKPLVYECGPSCKCPPSCPNRVSQHGITLPLEIFKTESRGWGVRCLSSISSGSFICEYIGELLDDKEAEQRAGGDEYLFDIGQNYNDTTLSDGLSAVMPEMTLVAYDIENVGFTIDAAKYGNVGRFINHSCNPNLYAQNVLYDYEDKRIPHIMMFAAENIPPLQELTYHYNYTIDQVFDSEGNIKKKNCYCGSAECTGRMY